MSLAVRKLVEIALHEASKEDSSSIAFQLSMARMERERKQRYQQQLIQDYISLINDPDSDFEELLKEFAEEHNLTYPPDVEHLNIWDIDLNLSKTLHAVRSTVDTSGQTTLRNVYRQNGQSKSDTLRYLSKLRELKQVNFKDVPKGSKCTISLIL